MRKFLVVFAALTLILAFTAVDSMAKAKVSFKGDIRFRGWSYDNYDRDDQANDSAQYMDTRGRFKMTAKTSDDLSGVFWFEIGDAYIGENETAATGFRNDNDQTIVEVKQMYIDFKLPWNKAFEFQIGAVPAYDLPKSIVFGMDAAGLKGKYEFKNGKIIGYYYKDKENLNQAADRDTMGGVLYYNITKDVRLGAHITYLNDRANQIDAIADNPGSQDGIWWYGFTAKGKIPTATPLKFTADLIIMDGERKYDNGATTASTDTSITDWEGLAIDVTLGGDLGPVYLEAFYQYASGDDNPNDSKEKIWRNIETGKEDYRRMMIVSGYPGFDSGSLSDSNGDFLGAGYNGISMIGAKGIYKPTSKLKLTGQFANVMSAEDSDKYTSVYYSTSKFDRSVYKRGNKDIGNELDLIVDYKIYKELNLRGVFAYMFSGDYFKETADTSGNTGALSPDDVWFLGYNLTYKF
jgi:hypothetical protein